MVLQKLFDGSRNAWSNTRLESLRVDTTTVGDSAVFNSLQLNNVDLSLESITINYSLNDLNRMSGAYLNASITFFKLGSNVIAYINFLNNGLVQSQNGTAGLQFDPNTVLPVDFQPSSDTFHSLAYQNNISGRLGAFEFKTNGEIVFYTGRNTATLAVDQFVDGEAFVVKGQSFMYRV